METSKIDDKLVEAYYKYAVYEALPQTMQEREAAYEQAQFSVDEITLFKKYMRLQYDVQLFEDDETKQEELDKKMQAIRAKGLDAERYWTYVDGMQSLHYKELLAGADYKNFETSELIALFRQAFIIPRSFIFA